MNQLSRLTVDRKTIMPNFKLRLTKSTQQQLNQMLESARRLGDVRMVKRITAILLVNQGIDNAIIISVLQVSCEAIRLWTIAFLSTGPAALKSKKFPGRKPKLTKTQKKELRQMIVKGPQKTEYLSACWRSR